MAEYKLRENRKLRIFDLRKIKKGKSLLVLNLCHEDIWSRGGIHPLS
jgi:hypothetical protein